MKKGNKDYLTGFLAIIVLVLIFYQFLVSDSVRRIKSVEIGGTSVKVELALTTMEHEQGLSRRKNLKENEGMLFVFPQIGKQSFWMKDMEFPIDMIWIDKEMKVVYIKKNALPELFPENYSSKKDAKYVLEVVSGFSDEHMLKLGDVVNFTY